jgi:hypothetical protein
MNERIRELEERCWEELVEEERMYTVFNTKKFAQLIVRECIEISKKIETDLESSDMFTESNAASNAAGLVAYRIAQNFGVEE